MVVVITVIDVFFMIPAYLRADAAIPDGVLALLMTMTGAVFGGYFGTSCVENYTDKKFRRDEQPTEEEAFHEDQD
jgi:cation transport regulator ChaB